MKNSGIIAWRELRERVSNRSFILAAFVGPLTLLVLLYLLFAYGGKSAKTWDVLVADPGGVFEAKMLPRPDSSVQYSFIQDYVEIEEFAAAKKYKQFDALVEINEKVVSNKTGFVFYREQPARVLEKKIEFQVEKRLEEVLVKRFTDLSLTDFRKIKQPLRLNFRDVYDPYGESSDKRGWVGVLLGTLVFVFIALFGMTVLRSVATDKSSRIAEVILASAKPRDLMLGKIIGIGSAAVVQFLFWTVIIAVGLWWMRAELFPDLVSANITQIESAASGEFFNEKAYEYNEFVELIYQRIQFGPMLATFGFFFIAGYFFYGTICAGLGAALGSENDGQQFVIPLFLVLCFGAYAGYYTLLHPSSPLTEVFHYLPLTSPSVVLVKLALGYPEGEGYTLYLSALILILSGILALWKSGRIYKHGVLQNGYRLNFSLFWKWIMRKG